MIREENSPIHLLPLRKRSTQHSIPHACTQQHLKSFRYSSRKMRVLICRHWNSRSLVSSPLPSLSTSDRDKKGCHPLGLCSVRTSSQKQLTWQKTGIYPRLIFSMESPILFPLTPSVCVLWEAVPQFLCGLSVEVAVPGFQDLCGLQGLGRDPCHSSQVRLRKLFYFGNSSCFFFFFLLVPHWDLMGMINSSWWWILAQNLVQEQAVCLLFTCLYFQNSEEDSLCQPLLDC